MKLEENGWTKQEGELYFIRNPYGENKWVCITLDFKKSFTNEESRLIEDALSNMPLEIEVRVRDYLRQTRFWPLLKWNEEMAKKITFEGEPIDENLI